MYKEGRLEAYVSDAAARKPAPGGGSVSALVGALAAAMSEMSANFTASSKKYASVERMARDMLAELGQCRNGLLDAMDQDVIAYSAVDRSLKMPRDTEVQRAARRQALHGALLNAIEPPLQIIRQSARIAGIAERLVDIGKSSLISDVGISSILAEAACESARLNVIVNLKYLKDVKLTRSILSEVEGLCHMVESSRRKVMRKVNTALKSMK